MFRNPIFCLLFFCVLQASSQNWKPLPSKLPAGQITGLHIAKGTSRITVSTLKNGIYQSLDNGNSWIGRLSTNDSIFSFASLNDKILVAGGKGGVYRSLDSGKTWNRFSIFADVAVGQIAVHPSGQIIIGTGSILDFTAGIYGKGVFISGDTAQTWVARNSGIKNNILVEALAIMPNGTILIGLNGDNSGLNDGSGIYRSENLGLSWQRIILNVKTPTGYTYQDLNLRPSSISAILVLENHVIASISGVYVNYALGFSMKINADNITSPTANWKVNWFVDTIAADGSFYEQAQNIFQDSKNRQWASISGSSSLGNNVIYSGSILLEKPWKLHSEGLESPRGKYLFGEDAEGKIYAAGYYSGNEVYVLDEMVTGLERNSFISDSNYKIYPNPARSGIVIKQEDMAGPLPEIEFMSLEGIRFHVKFKVLSSGEYFLEIPVTAGKGIYILKITSAEGIVNRQVVVE